ncbi:MAG: redoxin domain-containing protein [Bacteroidales bacterium]|nr:redoxin domain-containing protein [Bacteroidales bacterium]MBK9358233.1 redoxin domain-containing protein [Bacteroidales bacterium]
MKSTIPVLLTLVFMSALSPLRSQDIRVMDFKGLEFLLNQRNDTTYVINFWATWCIPCVKELPAFQQLHDQYGNNNVHVILVSLDFKKDLETRLKPFIIKNKLTPEVILLYDPDGNAWIDKVSSDWSGALPATMIFNRNFRAFYEKSFIYEELQNIINLNLIPK